MLRAGGSREILSASDGAGGGAARRDGAQHLTAAGGGGQDASTTAKADVSQQQPTRPVATRIATQRHGTVGYEGGEARGHPSTGQATPEAGRRPGLVVNQHSDVAVAHGGTIGAAARAREGLGDARHRDQVFGNDGKTAGPAAADMVIRPRRP